MGAALPASPHLRDVHVQQHSLAPYDALSDGPEDPDAR